MLVTDHPKTQRTGRETVPQSTSQLIRREVSEASIIQDQPQMLRLIGRIRAPIRDDDQPSQHTLCKIVLVLVGVLWGEDALWRTIVLLGFGSRTGQPKNVMSDIDNI